MKIKSGDNVIIIAGKDKGKSGKVRRAMPKKEKLVVEGLNMVKRHTKPRGPGSPGGIIEKEAPITISNVMILDNENKPSRIGYEFDDMQRKWRIFRSTGERIDQEPINDPTGDGRREPSTAE